VKLAVLAITRGGKKLAENLCHAFTECTLIEGSEKVQEKLSQIWKKFDGIICIMAAGIVVRSIAGLVDNKKTDPCVIVLDEKGKHIISLLSGHLGGGNSLAEKIAAVTGGTAVITTSSDIQKLTAIDLWAEAQKLIPANNTTLTTASCLLADHGVLKIYSDCQITTLPADLQQVHNMKDADLVISHKIYGKKILQLYPKNLVVGTGCNRGTPAAEFEEALAELLSERGFSSHSICQLASIDAKNDETGLLQFAKSNQWPIHFFSREQINQVTDITISQAALKAVGAIGVAEPTALLSAKTDKLLCRKRKWSNITMAVAEVDFSLSERVLDPLNT